MGLPDTRSGNPSGGPRRMTSATPDRAIDHGHEAKLRRIMESGIVGVFYWLMNGTITEANDAFLQMIGRERADLESGGLDWRTLTPPEWVAEDERRSAEIVKNGMAGPWEKEFFTKSGARVPIFISGAILDDSRDTGLA